MRSGDGREEIEREGKRREEKSSEGCLKDGIARLGKMRGVLYRFVDHTRLYVLYSTLPYPILSTKLK